MIEKTFFPTRFNSSNDGVVREVRNEWKDISLVALSILLCAVVFSLGEVILGGATASGLFLFIVSSILFVLAICIYSGKQVVDNSRQLGTDALADTEFSETAISPLVSESRRASVIDGDRIKREFITNIVDEDLKHLFQGSENLKDSLATATLEKSILDSSERPSLSLGFQCVLQQTSLPTDFKLFVSEKSLLFSDIKECMTALFLCKFAKKVSPEGIEDNMSSRLLSKITSFGKARFYAAASKILQDNCLLTALGEMGFSHCPFFWLSYFLRKAIDPSKMRYICRIFLCDSDKEVCSIGAYAAYCVSRIGLSNKKDTIFSRKYWVFAKVISEQLSDYDTLKGLYKNKNTKCFEALANVVIGRFNELVAEESHLGLSEGDLTIEDIVLLLEHGISSQGMDYLKMLPLKRLDFFNQLTNIQGKNLLADWMLSFGDSLFELSDLEESQRELFYDVFSREAFSRKANSIICLTWKEVAILSDLEERRAERFLSRIEGESIRIRHCCCEEWYAMVRIYNLDLLQHKFSVDSRKGLGPVQAGALSWTNWSRSVYKSKNKIKKNS